MSLQTLPGSSGNTHWLEKVFRIGFIALIGFGLVKAYNAWIAPSLNTFLSNIWYELALGVPLAALVAFVVMNPSFLWMQYKNICHYVTSFFINLDPLSFIDRYVDDLRNRRQKLQENKTQLKGTSIALGRKMDKLEGDFNDLMKKAEAAKQLNRIDDFRHMAEMANTLKESYSHYKPLHDRLEANLKFLDKLDENWGRSIEKLQQEVDVKREEYLDFKKTAKTLKNAEAFARGDTPEAKIFQQAVSSLEASVTQKMAYIDQFQKMSDDVMKGIDLDKQVSENDGVSLFDQWQNNKNIFLPEGSWIEPEVISTSISDTAEPVSRGSKGDNSTTAKLLEV